MLLLTIERQFTSFPGARLVRGPVDTGRAAPWAGQAGACPYFLPEGPQRSPGSRPAAGRRAAVRSSLEAGGAAPYLARRVPRPQRGSPPGESQRRSRLLLVLGRAAATRGHAASLPASDRS